MPHLSLHPKGKCCFSNTIKERGQFQGLCGWIEWVRVLTLRSDSFAEEKRWEKSQTSSLSWRQKGQNHTNAWQTVYIGLKVFVAVVFYPFKVLVCFQWSWTRHGLARLRSSRAEAFGNSFVAAWCVLCLYDEKSKMSLFETRLLPYSPAVFHRFGQVQELRCFVKKTKKPR